MTAVDRHNAFRAYHRRGFTLAAALLAAVCLCALHAGLGAAQDADPAATAESSLPPRAELKDKQLDVALEARDIERVLSKLKRASDLSKERITNAAQVAESASGALDRGDSKSARENAEQAAAMFQEIAKQLEALLAEETPQRLAAAQNLAQQLSQAERQFLRQFPDANGFMSNGMGKGDPRKQNKGKRGAGGTQQPGDQKKNGGAGGKNTGDKQGEDKDRPPTGSGQANNNDKTMPAETGDQKQGNGENRDREQGDDKKGDDKKGGSGEGDGKELEAKNGAGKKGDDQDKNETGKDGKEKEINRGNGSGGDGEKRDAGDGLGDAEEMPTDEELRAALARRAEQLAESGRTLDDILKTILQSTDPADAEAARLVEAILKETSLSEAVANMQRVAGTIGSGNLDDARLASLDVADRLEIASQRLGNAYRLIVAPQAEELRDIENALALLREKLEKLQTRSQVASWQREMRELLDRMEKLGIDDTLREQLLEEMKKDGLSAAPGGNVAGWGLVDGRYVAPSTYRQAIINIQEEVQARLQNLLVGDLESSPDEATPPKYQDLVERYYQVLSRDSGRPSGAKAVGSPKNKK